MSLDSLNTHQYHTEITAEFNDETHIHIDGEEEVVRLSRELDEANEKLAQAENELDQARDRARRFRQELETLKENTGIKFLQDRISELEGTLSRAREQFEQFASAANLFGTDAWGTDVSEFIASQAADIERGLITVDEAKTRLKTQFSSLFSNTGSGAIDAEVMQTIVASLKTLSDSISDVQTKMQSLLNGGIPAATGGGGGQVSDILDQINRATAGLSEEARIAYEPVTKLISALVDFGKIPSDSLYGVSKTFENLSAVMGGSLGTKTVTNLTTLMSSLQQISAKGAIKLNLDVSGINELQNKRAALKNLADYLPQIASIDTNKLDRLSKINLTNFNNIKISKSSIESIAQLAESLRLLNDIPYVFDGSGGTGGSGGSKGTASNVKLIGQLADLHSAAAKLQTINPDLNLSELLSEIETLKAEIGDAGEMSKSELSAAQALYDELNTKLKTYRDGVATTTMEIEKQGEVTRTQQITQREFINQLNPLLNTITQTEKFEQKLTGEYSLTRNAGTLRNELHALEAEINKASVNDKERLLELQYWYEGIRDRVAQYAEEVKRAQLTDPSAVSGLNTTQLLGSLETATNKAMSLTNNEGFLKIIDTLKTKVHELQEKITEFSRTGQGDVSALRAEFEQYKNAIESLNKIGLVGAARNDPSAGDADARSASQNLNFIRQVESAAKQAQSLLSNNTKLFGTELGSRLQGIISQYDDFIQRIIDSPPKTKAEFDNLKTEFDGMKEGVARVGLEMEQTGIKGNTMLTRFAQGIKKFGGWTIVTRALTAVIRLGRQMITNVKEIDTAMTQFRIVTRASSEDIAQFGNSVARTAQQIGASITDLVDSATTYARLGYSLEESSVLAQYTSMLQAVGAIDTSDAQDAITAITKAYNIDVNQIESVMDKLVQVGNNFPISVSQIAEGLNNASSALAAAGNTFEQSVALLTAANTTVNLCRAA